MASIFELDEFKVHEGRWLARAQAFRVRRAYYDGSVYQSAWGALGWLRGRLGGAVRGLYLPCARAVNLDSGIVPGGWATEGAAPAQLAEVFGWSDWSIMGPLFVHYGALYGNVVLRVSDVRGAGRVVICPVRPEHVLLVRAGLYGREAVMALCVQRVEVDGRSVEYAEVVEARRVRTFIEGEAAGVDGRPASYDNALGFVPFVEVRHIDGGDELGACAFQDALNLLDAVNEVATDLAEIVKKHAKPKWAVLGADESDLSNEDDIWTFPQGSDVKVLVPGIDVTGVLKFLQDTRMQVERSIPELAFDEIISKYNLATATVELQLAELVLLIRRVRPNYDRGLEMALGMAARALAGMGVSGYGELAAVRFDDGRAVLPVDRRATLELELLEAQIAAAKRGGQDATNDRG